jgi:GAF domain-containing protein
LSRESDLAQTFVHLADSLVEDFDVAEHLTTLADSCVGVLDVSAAGLMLVTPEGELRVVASSSEAMRVVESFELQSQEGPCVECYRARAPVLNQHLEDVAPRWPHFAAFALNAGFQSVHALPLRLRGDVIGALNLFRSDRSTIDDEDVRAAQALADVATISILQHRADLESGVVKTQLATALESRIVIEQAKGILAERTHLGMEAAFSRMRYYARSHNLKLADVARGVVEGTTTIPGLIHQERDQE